MTEQRGTGRALARLITIGLTGGLLVAAALAVANPATLVGLAPEWFTDPVAARAAMRVAGGVAILVAVLAGVAVAVRTRRRLSALHAAGRLPTRRAVLSWIPSSVLVVIWLSAAALAVVGSKNAELTRDTLLPLLAGPAAIDLTMMLTGLTLVAVPLVAAGLARRSEARGLAVTLVVLAVLLLLPEVAVVREARNDLQDARRDDRTECVYFVGGYDCPD
ncbi:hypothetical protein AB0M02_22335 [Actinoplanes sp. NPDC051861]|uniref:hypothetical protein n=1 Tax=Actinoplanes sp. NPDC051861 TaxID=3155170 RepID=UPI00343DD0E1